MSISEVSISNQAIGWLGGTLITSLNDDQVEAQLAKANFASSRDAVMEDHAWTFANARAILTPATDPPAFGTEKKFSVPPDYLRILRVEQNANFTGTLEWVLEGQFIIAIADRIFVTYTRRITDPNLFSPAFVQALAQRLAADMAISLTESRKIAETHWELYQAKIDAAAATDGMQGVNQQIRSTRLLRARRGGTPEPGGFSIGDPLI